jgi:hypothetical protein
LEIRQDIGQIGGEWGVGSEEWGMGNGSWKPEAVSSALLPTPYSPLPSLLFLKNYGVFRLPIVS